MPKHYGKHDFFLSSCAQTSYRMACKPSYHMLRTNVHRLVLFFVMEAWHDTLRAFIIREINMILMFQMPWICYKA